MAAELENHQVLPQKLLVEQIPTTVKKIQWSYALFWSLSTSQPGTLEWGAGYYNDQIKTRKTTQLVELDSEQMGLQRSKQLRELYESLASVHHCGLQTKRSCASLSPEDLTDTEWYYLVCMSFTFTPGQGLPYKAFEEDQYIWLNNATLADPTIFSRSLIAKGAGIQTIVCIPIMGGVLELGTTNQVPDDPALVMRITSLFWGIPNPVCTQQSISNPTMPRDEDGILCPSDNIDRKTLLESADPTNIPLTQPPYVQKEKEPDNEVINEPHTSLFEESSVGFPEDSANERGPIQQLEDLFEIDGLNSMLSQTQAEQQPMDDDFRSVHLHGPFNSNEDVGTSFVDVDRIGNTMLENIHGGNHRELTWLDVDGDDSHYMNMVAMILQNSNPKRQILCSLKASQNSSFVGCRGDLNTPMPLTSMPQNLPKKILVHRAWLVGSHKTKKHQEEKGSKEKVSYPEGESGPSHVLSERRRREKMNEKFVVLRSLLPSISKIDKASVLGDTIEYLKELKRRVHQLESRMQSVELDTSECRRNDPDAAERTSDDHCSKDIMNYCRNTPTNKRKACEVSAEYNWVLSKDGPIAITVTIKGKEVLVEVHCPWRESLLLQIIKSISELHLDPLMVQSSATDGILALRINSKFRSSAAASPGMIKGSLERAIGRGL